MNIANEYKQKLKSIADRKKKLAEEKAKIAELEKKEKNETMLIFAELTKGYTDAEKEKRIASLQALQSKAETEYKARVVEAVRILKSNTEDIDLELEALGAMRQRMRSSKQRLSISAAGICNVERSDLLGTLTIDVSKDGWRKQVIDHIAVNKTDKTPSSLDRNLTSDILDKARLVLNDENIGKN